MTDGDLAAMRLWSALLGAGVIVSAWAALRELSPNHPCLALTGAGFIDFEVTDGGGPGFHCLFHAKNHHNRLLGNRFVCYSAMAHFW